MVRRQPKQCQPGSRIVLTPVVWNMEQLLTGTPGLLLVGVQKCWKEREFLDNSVCLLLSCGVFNLSSFLDFSCLCLYLLPLAKWCHVKPGNNCLARFMLCCTEWWRHELKYTLWAVINMNGRDLIDVLGSCCIFMFSFCCCWWCSAVVSQEG